MIQKLSLLFFSFVLVSGLFAQSNQPATDADIAAMQQLIDSKGYRWVAGRTTLSDLPAEERQHWLGFVPPMGYDEWLAKQPKLTADPKMVFPTAFDWRDSGIVTPVKNQGGCGSCWAFGATGAFEAAIKKHDGIVYDLAEQQPLSCNVYGSTCAGGWIEPVYELFQRYGAVLESCMPYQQADLPCTQDQCPVAVKLKTWVNVADDVNSIKQALMTGPVATGFTVYDDFFNYTSGCYQHTWGGVAGGHIIVVVGWDDNFCGTGQGAWICKNSWGQGWGNLAGYFYIKWGDSDIGRGTVLPIYPPDPVTLNYEFHQFSNPYGGDDNVPDPGMDLTMSVAVKNIGLTTAYNVSAILRSPTAGILISDSVATFPSIPFDQVKFSAAPHFSITLDSAVVPGSRMDFTMQVTCAQGIFDCNFHDYVGHFDTVFVDGLESGSSNWTHGGTLDDWQFGKPSGVGKSDAKTAHSGSNIMGNNIGGDYAANAGNYVESRVINCSNISHARLCFDRWLSIEKGIYDQARVLVNGYTIWQNDPDYDMVNSRWYFQDFDISPYVEGDGTAKIRFELQSDVGLQLGGWNLDDIAIVGIRDYVPGDANGDKIIDIADAVYLIEYIFGGGAAPNPFLAGDSSCDGFVDISDAVYLIAYIFGGAPAPGCK